MENNCGENSDFCGIDQPKKIRFKDSIKDEDIDMVMDLDMESTLFWKDKIFGRFGWCF